MSQFVYTRIPLTIDATFSTDGKLRPRRLFFEGRYFEIDRILSVRRFKPPQVAAIAPIEYTVVIDGVEKCIYYEPSSGTWFSVKGRKM